MVESSTKPAQNYTDEDVKEAMSIIDIETQRRVEEVSQRIEFMCASLRAQGNTEINKMLMAIRDLTVEEFCEKYGADAQYFLSQQTIKRQGNPNMKRPSLIEIEDPNISPNKRSKFTDDIEENKSEVSKTEKRSKFEDIFVFLERKNQPKISIRFDPDRSVKELGNMSMDAPNESLKKLDSAQRSRVCEQIQDIQNQLETLKRSIS